MEMGKVGNVRSEINVTPLVDVCLVLLIIFIVIQPMTQMGYNATIPPKAPPSATPSAPPPDQLVVSYTADKKIFLNKQEMTQTALVTQLGQILENRREKVVFFSVDDTANYGETMNVMDAVRNSTGYKENAEEGVKIGIVMEPVPVR
ncbi:MAG TPA: biopolymer transporter ExbD [Thermoanaerobaculia bacterium]|jgi:biopolymer transport protein TolR|nr:biopolymer transporter ExbD [Thermoanaerobaculia bacterium]